MFNLEKNVFWKFQYFTPKIHLFFHMYFKCILLHIPFILPYFIILYSAFTMLTSCNDVQQQKKKCGKHKIYSKNQNFTMGREIKPELKFSEQNFHYPFY